MKPGRTSVLKAGGFHLLWMTLSLLSNYSSRAQACLSRDQLLKIQKAPLGMIHTHMSLDGWVFQGANTGITIPTFTSSKEYDLVKWQKKGDLLRLYTSIEKPSVMVLNTTDVCMRSLLAELSAITPTRTAVLKDELQTFYEIGNTVVLLSSRKRDHNSIEYVVIVYDKTSVSKTDIEGGENSHDPVPESHPEFRKVYPSLYQGKNNPAGATIEIPTSETVPFAESAGGLNSAGVGQGFDLSGRELLMKPKIEDYSNEQGRIVIEVIVDENGVVQRAEGPSRGSTLSNATLTRKCKEAAMKTRFSPSPDGVKEQRGSISFNFIVR